MTPKKLLFALSFLIVVFAACTKEKSIDSSTGGSGNSDIIGSYDFVDIYVKAESIVELDDAGWETKTVTQTEYRTKSNAGQANINSNTITYTGLSYSIDTIVKAYYYDEDVLIDSFELPFVVSLPVTTASSKYKKVGSDSLYYEGGGPINIGGTVNPGIPQGVKYKIENNLLILTSPFYITKTETVQGAQQVTTNSGTSVVTLRKK